MVLETKTDLLDLVKVKPKTSFWKNFDEYFKVSGRNCMFIVGDYSPMIISLLNIEPID